MKKLMTVAALFVATVSAHAGAFSFNCSTDVSCSDLLSDVVTEKFTTKFPNDIYEIFVLSHTSVFSNGTSASYAVVGVVPKSKLSHYFAPNRSWDSVSYYGSLGNAYDKQNKSREIIRKAVESMMAACEDSKGCEILGSNRP
jgi:hypothetical protein